MEIRNDITYKKDTIFLSLSMCMSIFFMLFTNPNTMSVFWLLWLPVFVFLNSYFIAKLAFKFFTKYSELKIKSTAAVLSVGPALIIILGSLGSIGLQDIALALIFVAGLSWYLRRYQVNSVS